jgi:hypothetical protein
MLLEKPKTSAERVLTTIRFAKKALEIGLKLTRVAQEFLIFESKLNLECLNESLAGKFHICHCNTPSHSQNSLTFCSTIFRNLDLFAAIIRPEKKE